jgi:hypothetical protein
MSRASTVTRHFTGIPEQLIEVISLHANGDCFYQAILLALTSKSFANSNELNSDNNNNTDTDNAALTIESMRNIVASALTIQHFTDYLSYYSAGLDDYLFMANIISLEQLKQRIQTSASNTKSNNKQLQLEIKQSTNENNQIVGGNDVISKPKPRKRRNELDNLLTKIIWADHLAIQTIADYFNLFICILDMSSIKYPYTLIQPNVTSNNLINNNKPDSNNTKTHSDSQYVVLHRTRREHFNLISIADQTLFTYNELPEIIRKNWKIPSSIE